MAKVTAGNAVVTEAALKNKRRFIKKEPRNILMSHRAYLLFKAMADKKDIGIGDFFEILSQEIADERLPEEERQAAVRKAQEIIEARTREIEELERRLAENKPT
jgi:hypothetical protein